MPSRALDTLIPHQRRHELDHVDIPVPADQVWLRARHGDVGSTPLVNALIALRTLPARVLRRSPEPPLRFLDELISTPERPGFQVLIDDPPHEVAVGAIGKVWRPSIPFTHVPDAEAFYAFDEPGWIKVAWALHVIPLEDHATRLELELRVDATDDASWRKFTRYFRVIGPFSRMIRRSLLRTIARSLTAPKHTRRARREAAMAL